MQKNKFYILLFIAIIVVVGIWVFTLKLNLQNGFGSGDGGSGLNFSNLKNEISEIINKSPLSKDDEVIKNENTKTDNLKDLTDKLAEEIKKADWQTYTNQEYGFEFKYPKNWVIENNLESFIPSFKVKDQKLSFSCGLFDNTEFLSIEDWVNENDFFELKQYEDLDVYVGHGINEPITKTLNETEIKVYFGGASGGGTFGTALIPLNGKILNIAYSLPPSANQDRDEVKNTFNQILSTFKFLEE